MTNPSSPSEMEDKAVELEPCPFCGSDQVSMSYWATPQSPEPAGRYVECEDCGCGGPGVKINDPRATPSAEESAAEGWNTRALSTSRDGLVEALETISSQAICYGMRADETELRDWLKFISETADAALSRLSSGEL